MVRNPLVFRLLLLLLVTAPPASAAILRVEADGTGDFPFIQDAIDAATAGDIVLLGPGTYHHAVTRALGSGTATAIAFLKSGVTLQGAQGAAATILDGETDHHCLVGQSLAATTVVRGVTLANGRKKGYYYWGGGMLLFYSSPVIEQCVFRDCAAVGGGGLFCYSMLSSVGPVIRSNLFRDNHAFDLGAAIEVYLGGAWSIENNTFVSNTADDAGGAVLLNSTAGRVDGNIFWNNRAVEGDGGALTCFGDSGPAVLGECNLFWQNTASHHGDVAACGVRIGEDGNLQADPLFCDPAQGDFRLQSDSPGAPAQSGDCGLIGGLPVGCEPSTGGPGLAIGSVGGEAGQEVTVPISLQGPPPLAAASYQSEISFDPQILTYVRLETAGTLSEDLLAVGNSPSSGVLLIAAAGSEPIGSDDVLVQVVFAIPGNVPAGSRSPVDFASFVWGEAFPATVLTNGSVTVGEPLTVSGVVTYYSTTPFERPVPGVTLNLSGPIDATTTSGADGRYGFDNLWYGFDLSITPTFDDPSTDGVSAFDASLVLAHLVESTTLDANQRIAADLTGDGTVSAEDASRILRVAVGDETAVPSPLWQFQPEAAVVDSLPGTMTDLDFAGILRGDVSGDWCATDPCTGEGGRSGLAWSGAGAWKGGVFEVVVRVEDAGARSLEFELLYDANVLRFAAFDSEGGGLWATSESEGRASIAGATAPAWPAGKPVVVARLEPIVVPARRTEVTISGLRIDERDPETRVVHVLPHPRPAERFVDFDVHVSPNPGRDAVTLAVVGARGPIRIDVFDVAGRRIRAYGGIPDAEGRRALVWDRRDGGGSRVVDGVYFLRATAGERLVTRRIVLVP
jgi:hypothetical protein